jgi:UDP-apiose/xylose synthase
VSAGARRPTPVGVRSIAGDGRLPDGRVPRIAVLGAGGFLGSHLVPALRAGRECEIDAVDVDLTKLAPADGVRRIQARLDRPGLIEELVDRCEVIISLTALCNPSLYNTQPLAVIDASYTDLVPVVKLCTARRRWLIHFSTCEVYGRSALDNLGAPMPAMREDESALWLGPVHLERWSYACAKQLLERVIFASGKHHGLPFTIVRPFNVIGPRMDFVPGVDGEGVPRVLAAFMSALLAGDEMLLVDGGQRRRSFVYVDDFVAAIGRMLDRPQVAQGQIFNLGHPGNELSIAELAKHLGDAYRAQVPGATPRVRSATAEEVYGPGYDDCDQRLPDIDKAVTRLGWQPSTTLAEMLPPIVQDYRARYSDRVAARLAELAAQARRRGAIAG